MKALLYFCGKVQGQKRQTLIQNPGILYPGNKAKILLLSLVFNVFAEATLKEVLECNW